MEARLKSNKPEGLRYPIGARICICAETAFCPSSIGDMAIITRNHPYDSSRTLHFPYTIVWDDRNHEKSTDLNRGMPRDEEQVTDGEFYYVEMLSREEIMTHWSYLIRRLNKLTDEQLKGWDT